MANTQRTNTRKATSRTTQSKTPTATEPASSSTIIPKEVDPSQFVTVRNGFRGRLIYQSRHTGELFEWDDFGAEQEMELRELRNAKTSAKKSLNLNLSDCPKGTENRL